jgi:hypothetical protein
MREIADVRVHGTTGETPLLRFERDEAAVLQPLKGHPPFREVRDLVPGASFESARSNSRRSLPALEPTRSSLRAIMNEAMRGNPSAGRFRRRARLPSSRVGHQIQGASVNPFHATPQSRTRLKWRPRQPLPQDGYRTLSRCAGRSRQFARACWPTRRRVYSCAIAATPF